MARVNIYVPDDLKARMDGAGDAINWSEAVRPVIQSAIADFEHRKDGNMTTAIERLRASKQEHVLSQQSSGKEEGRKWAENYATYEELARLSRYDLSKWKDPYSLLKDALDDLIAGDLVEYTYEDPKASDEYIAGFIEGAQGFFAEVKDHL
jgi:hypothetical protein